MSGKTGKLPSSMSFNHRYSDNDNHSQTQKKSRRKLKSRHAQKYEKNKSSTSSLKPSPITTECDKYRKSRSRQRDLSPARSIASSSSSLSYNSEDDDEFDQTLMRSSLHNDHRHNHNKLPNKLPKKRTISPRIRRSKKSTNSSPNTTTTATAKPPLTPTSRHPHSPQNSWYYNCPTSVLRQPLTPKGDDNNMNASIHGQHAQSLTYKLSEIINIKKEDRHLSTWSKMEIAEWLQINWYTTQSNHNRSKLLTYINKIKREKKFNGENLYKLNHRGLKVLAQRYLGLRKGETDYKIFINRIRELQSKYVGLTEPRQRSHTFTRTGGESNMATEDEKEENNKHSKHGANKNDVHHRLNRAKSHKTETENDQTSLQQKQSEEFLRKKSLSFNTFNDHPKMKKVNMNHQHNKKRTRAPKKRKRSRLKQVTANKIKRTLLSASTKEKPLKLTIHDEKSNKISKANKRNRNRQKTWNIMDINHQHKIQQHPQNQKFKSLTPNASKKKKRSKYDNIPDGPSLTQASYSHIIKSKKKVKQKLPKFKNAKSNTAQKATTPTPRAIRKKRKEKTAKLSNIKDNKSKRNGNGLSITFENKSPRRKYNNNGKKKKKKRPTSAKASNISTHKKYSGSKLGIISSSTSTSTSAKRKKKIKMRTKRISTPKATSTSKRKRSRNKRSISTISPKKGRKHIKKREINRNKRVSPNKYGAEIEDEKPNNGIPPSSSRSCPPLSLNTKIGCKPYDGYDDLGLVILETADSDTTKTNSNLSKGLQFSVTSPASSPSPQANGHKHINNHNMNIFKYNTQRRGYSSYEGVTADELLQLISYGHADEIDTDYDTDTNNNDIYTYINHNDYNEYISETPSPQEHLPLNVDVDEDDDTFSTIYNAHRLQLVGSNSANYSNISNISTSISSLQSSQCTLTDNDSHNNHKGTTLNNSLSPHGPHPHLSGHASSGYRPKHFRFSDHSDNTDTDFISDQDENINTVNNVISPRSKVKSRGHNKSLTDGFGIDKLKRNSGRNVTKLQSHRSAENHHDETKLTYGTSSESTNTNGSASIHIKDIPLFDNITSGAVTNKTTTMVIPSIFAIDDTDTGDGDDIFPPKIALSPIISTDTLKTSGDGGLLLNMMCYSMTDESTDEEDDKYVSHRNSTVKMALQTTKRVMQYALHNSPDTTPLHDLHLDGDNDNTEITTITSPFGDIDLSLINSNDDDNDNDEDNENNDNNNDNDLPNLVPTIPKLTSSKTGLATLADIADFVNDSDGTE